MAQLLSASELDWDSQESCRMVVTIKIPEQREKQVA
jgi:hypothetical protein